MLKLLQEEMPSASWIIKDNDKALLSKCQTVPLPLSKENQLIMQKMIDWVRVSQDQKLNSEKALTEAIGIAAPQIGENVKMYYILLPIFDEKTDKVTYYEHALVNPKIIAKSKQIGALKAGEGCLSVEDKHEGFVPRNYKIHVTGYDFLKKKNINIIARGYEAIVFQHEQDHLEKKLYYHHINKKEPWFKEDDWMMI